MRGRETHRREDQNGAQGVPPAPSAAARRARGLPGARNRPSAYIVIENAYKFRKNLKHSEHMNRMKQK